MKDWNYRLYTSRITLDLPEVLSIGYFENKIKKNNTRLLKWAVVGVEDQKAVIEAVFVEDKGEKNGIN